MQGFLFNTCVNEEILLLGLGRTAPIHGLDPHSRLYWRLHARLLKCELRAERKGQGLWKQESLREKLTQAIRNNSMIAAVKRIIKWASRTKDRWRTVMDTWEILWIINISLGLVVRLNQLYAKSVLKPPHLAVSKYCVLIQRPAPVCLSVLRGKCVSGGLQARSRHSWLTYV